MMMTMQIIAVVAFWMNNPPRHIAIRRYKVEEIRPYNNTTSNNDNCRRWWWQCADCIVVVVFWMPLWCRTRWGHSGTFCNFGKLVYMWILQSEYRKPTNQNEPIVLIGCAVLAGSFFFCLRIPLVIKGIIKISKTSISNVIMFCLISNTLQKLRLCTICVGC